MTENDIRNRMKKKGKVSFEKKEDIGAVWKELEEQEAKKEKLHSEYAETKKKLRQTRRQIVAEYFDVDKLEEVSKKFSKRLTNSLRFRDKQIKLPFLKSKSAIFVVFFATLFLGAILIFVMNRSASDPKTLGDVNTANSAGTSVIGGAAPEIEKEIPRESLDFQLLYPGSADKDAYAIAKVSPQGMPPAYTYLDRFSEDGSIFRVTQQQVPDVFDLAKTAEEFQATSVIQIDDNLIYHGYSEKGRTQSLLFTKNDLLVLIRSPEKFSDDLWASYVLSMQ